MDNIHPGFATHMLNEKGKRAARYIAEEFDNLLHEMTVMGVDGRYLAIVTTKLEEACFFAKKGIAIKPEYQEGNDAR